MNPIRLLDIQVANQIAAGEVIERPASVVKELVENSLDSGARVIHVEVDQGGRFLHVVDDGSGIPAESVALAFQRFATSKLQRLEDIWNLQTMGFRGEALPSIAAVSRVEIVTRTAEQAIARRLVIQAGEILEEGPAGGPVGTRITVRDLFFNTPARLKFLSSENTEWGYIQQLMQAFALGLPDVAFQLIRKGKTVLQTSGNQDLSAVVRQIWGRELAHSLYQIDHETPHGRLQGVLSYPDCVRKDRNYQFIFVNRRWVKVPGITKVLDELYADLVPRKHFPVAILHLEIPPAQVDVNVHPTKREVKFKHFSHIYSLLREGIHTALSRYHFGRQIQVGSSLLLPALATAPMDQAEELPPFALTPAALKPITLQEKPMAYQVTQELRAESPPSLPDASPQTLPLPYLEISSTPDPRKNSPLLVPIQAIGQICDNTYIVAHYGNGLALIDQHVAEERVIYEKLIEKEQILSQPLLMSVIIDLDPVEWGLLDEFQGVFKQVGFAWEAYGPASVAIRALPQPLPLTEAEMTFRAILQDLRETGVTEARLDAFQRLCKTIACHSAIRAGDSLTLEQMQRIVKNWSETRHPYTCPHGRPILLTFSKEELNKRFRRTW